LFLFFCADDKLEQTYIEECVNYLDKNPKCGAVSTWIQRFGDDNALAKIDPYKIKLPEMLVNNNFLGSSLVRYKAMKEIGFGNELKVFQKHNDYDRWVSILENGWELGVIPKELFLYRQTTASLSRSINIEDELAFRNAFIDKHRALFDKYYKFVIINISQQLLESIKWQNELSSGKDWLENQYHNLNIRIDELVKRTEQQDINEKTLNRKYNKLLVKIDIKNAKIIDLEKYAKYSLYPLLKRLKKIARLN